jgi:GrpB-like predicted nucleotidyltransferase (UPF0157 family)
MLAELEIKQLREILPSAHIIDIQHVGSTAIPGMLAKPIIDIQIAVDSLIAIKQVAIDRLLYPVFACILTALACLMKKK